jgi:hypothetical protein
MVVAVVALTSSRMVPGVRCSVGGGGCRLAEWGAAPTPTDALTFGDKGVKGVAAGAFGTVVVAVMVELLDAILVHALGPILRDFSLSPRTAFLSKSTSIGWAIPSKKVPCCFFSSIQFHCQVNPNKQTNKQLNTEDVQYCGWLYCARLQWMSLFVFSQANL